MSDSQTAPVLDSELLAILRCPISKAPLVQQGAWLVSTDAQNPVKYPVRGNIPVLLAEEAVPVTGS